jgi:3-isopropylmalate/(R)-2-methylmalate dehydratase small subunit
MQEIKTIKGRGLPLTIDDIDTDRIIPARYLRCVSFDGIGAYAFYDERYNEDGSPKNFPMNVPMYEKASIILAGQNFGCGSSREHAPQSLKRAGFQAVIAESFAEIFFGNSLTIGLVCVTMKKADIATICRHVAETPDLEILISLTERTANCNGTYYPVGIPESARTALLDGSYDLMRELLSHKEETQKLNAGLPY